MQQNLKVILKNIKDFSMPVIKNFNSNIKKFNIVFSTCHPVTRPAQDLKKYLCETQLCHEPKKICLAKKTDIL